MARAGRPSPVPFAVRGAFPAGRPGRLHGPSESSRLESTGKAALPSKLTTITGPRQVSRPQRAERPANRHERDPGASGRPRRRPPCSPREAGQSASRPGCPSPNQSRGLSPIRSRVPSATGRDAGSHLTHPGLRRGRFARRAAACAQRGSRRFQRARGRLARTLLCTGSRLRRRIRAAGSDARGWRGRDSRWWHRGA